MKKQKFITIEQARKLVEIERYNPITLAKKIIGYGIIGIGIATLPLPTRSVFLIMAGCALLAIDYKKLLMTIEFYGKEIFYWIGRALK